MVGPVVDCLKNPDVPRKNNRVPVSQLALHARSQSQLDAAGTFAPSAGTSWCETFAFEENRLLSGNTFE